MPKDLFSGHAKDYAAYRPKYPELLYQHILGHCGNTESAWDCATGNGQVAKRLAECFDTVWATDISQAQIDHADRLPNIQYSIRSAEETLFSDNQFDLITVGQAFHWFDHERFFGEAQRVLRPEGILAVWGYGPIIIHDPRLDAPMQHFYHEITGPYWEPERVWIDREYEGIDFPFRHSWPGLFKMELRYTVDQLIHYVNTWSAVKKFEQMNGYNPTDLLKTKLYDVLPDANVTFGAWHSLFLKMGTL